MIIMALDHTRDFFHSAAMIADPLDPATTTAPIFFTRWITHFCAPVFVMLSGVSAYLSSQKKSAGEASLFLVKRGAWLIIIEVTVVTMGLTFNPFYNTIILQVIWAMGWSTIILGLLSRFSYNAVLIAGIILFFGHNAIYYAALPSKGTASYIWSVLLTARGVVIPLNANHFIFAFYAILPWTGIMLLGYCMGRWFKKDFPQEKRKRLLLINGSLMITLFIVLRFLKGYGDPGTFSTESNALYSFLNTSKYPPSLLYAGMTLGPALIALAFLEHVQSGSTKIVAVYGRVPFFYYILHFYILHTLLVIVFFVSGHNHSQIADPNVPFLFRPVHFGYGLAVVYLIWLSVVAVLYLPCRWFNNYKMQHNYWWLSYL